MKNNQMKYLFVFFLCFATLSHSQELKEFNTVRLKTSETLMLTYGSWSLANLAVSSYGWATTDYEAKYFHQMNFAWSVVNLAIAIPSYFRARTTVQEHFRFQKHGKPRIKLKNHSSLILPLT